MGSPLHYICKAGSASFSVRGWAVCILGLLGRMVSVAGSQLFCCNVKVDLGNMS